MPNVVRVALPGYNALTDTNLDHFALYTDQDNVLIKEHSRNSQSVNNGNSLTVNHNLGYTPQCLVYNETATPGRYKLSNGYDVLLPVRSSVNDTSLIVFNNSGATRIIKYFIFYDNIG
jgi:hypothetical protein